MLTPVYCTPFYLLSELKVYSWEALIRWGRKFRGQNREIESMHFREWRFFLQISREKLSRLIKSQGEHNLSVYKRHVSRLTDTGPLNSVLHHINSHGDNLQGFMAQET